MEITKNPSELANKIIKGDKPVLGKRIRVTQDMIDKEWEEERKAVKELEGK